MRYGFINNFSQALAAELTAGATTLTLDGGGAALADASTDYRYKLTLVQRDAFGNETAREIVDVTGATGNDLTIVREQEGTAALSPWPSGTLVYGRVTAGHLLGLQPEPAIRTELIALGPVDFTAAGNASWSAPAGRKLYVDALEVIPEASSTASPWQEITALGSVAGRGERCRYSPDETLVAVGHWASPFLSVFDTSDWSVIPGTPVIDDAVFAVDWKPDGTQLAIGHAGFGADMTVLDTSDWSVVAGTPTASGTVYAISWSPDGSILAVGTGTSPFLTLYETTGWTAITTGIPDYADDVKVIEFSPDGSLMVVVTKDQMLYAYDTSDWSEVHSQSITGIPDSGEFSPDGTQIAFGYSWGDDMVHIFNTTTWAETSWTLPVFNRDVNDAAWMPDGNHLVVSYDPGGNTDQLIIVRVSDQVITATLPTQGVEGREIAVNAAGTKIVAGLDGADNVIAFENLGSPPAPTVNLGTAAGDATSLLNGAALAEFTQGERIIVNVEHGPAVTTLYAEVGTAEETGAAATLIVRGYTLEG